MESSTCECCNDQIEPSCYCPLSGVIDLLSRKYAMQVISLVGGHGSMRFGDIDEHISPASTATMSARLKELVEAGLIERTQYDEIPPRVEYELTDDGRELRSILNPVLEWATERQASAEA